MRVEDVAGRVAIIALARDGLRSVGGYPGTNHGFHKDSTPHYNEAAAKLAWERSIAWFRPYLACAPHNARKKKPA